MWMGIDVGTGGTRALLVDARGRVAGVHRGARRHAYAASAVGRAASGELVGRGPRAIRGALAQAGVPGAEVRGIGLSGQMHGLVICSTNPTP